MGGCKRRHIEKTSFHCSSDLKLCTKTRIFGVYFGIPPSKTHDLEKDVPDIRPTGSHY